MANEKRLIDANALIEQIRLMANRTSLGEISPSNISGIEVCGLILNAPTVDVEEVVRCKDCVNYCGFEHCKNGICDVDSVSKRAVYPDDFCSYGERKDNERKTD